MKSFDGVLLASLFAASAAPNAWAQYELEEEWLVCPSVSAPEAEVFVELSLGQLQRCRPAQRQVPATDTAAAVGEPEGPFKQSAAELAEKMYTNRSPANHFWPTGRVVMKFSSKPPGAEIFHGDAILGYTEVTGLLKVNALPEIRFELEGYRPCHFHDGQFSRGQFFCSLEPSD